MRMRFGKFGVVLASVLLVSATLFGGASSLIAAEADDLSLSIQDSSGKPVVSPLELGEEPTTLKLVATLADTSGIEDAPATITLDKLPAGVTLTSTTQETAVVIAAGDTLGEATAPECFVSGEWSVTVNAAATGEIASTDNELSFTCSVGGDLTQTTSVTVAEESEEAPATPSLDATLNVKPVGDATEFSLGTFAELTATIINTSNVPCENINVEFPLVDGLTPEGSMVAADDGASSTVEITPGVAPSITWASLGPGDSLVVTLNASVDLNEAGSITQTVSVSADGIGAPIVSSAKLNVVAEPAEEGATPSLSLSVVTSVPSVVPGGAFDLMINWTNPVQDTIAKGVSLTYTIPEGLTLATTSPVSVTSGSDVKVNVADGNQEISITDAALPYGELDGVTIKLQVPKSASVGTVYASSVKAVADGGVTAEGAANVTVASAADVNGGTGSGSDKSTVQPKPKDVPQTGVIGTIGVLSAGAAAAAGTFLARVIKRSRNGDDEL